jgi:hypothetical protein
LGLPRLRLWATGIAIGLDPTPPLVIMRLSKRRSDEDHNWFAGAGRAVIFFGMAVLVEMHHTGSQPAVRAEIVALIEHALADRPGDWRVSIIGSQANDRWEMRIAGPNVFERSYTLEGSAGEHGPQVIGKLVARMVRGRRL